MASARPEATPRRPLRPRARCAACAPAVALALAAPASQTRTLRHTTVVKQLVQGRRPPRSLTPGPDARSGSYWTPWDTPPRPQVPEGCGGPRSCCPWRGPRFGKGGASAVAPAAFKSLPERRGGLGAVTASSLPPVCVSTLIPPEGPEAAERCWEGRCALTDRSRPAAGPASRHGCPATHGRVPKHTLGVGGVT